MEKMDNKYLKIFKNYVETANQLSEKNQGIFWKIVINFSFFGEEKIKNELEKSAKEVKIAFFSIKSILKLNKNGGSQNGISNNPSGLTIENTKNNIPNIAPNITPNKSYNNPNSDLILIENNNNNNINIKEKEKEKEKEKDDDFITYEVCKQIYQKANCFDFDLTSFFLFYKDKGIKKENVEHLMIEWDSRKKKNT